MTEPEEGFVLTGDQFARTKRKLLEDPWKLARLLIPGDKGVERFHRPLLYLMAGKADLFFRCYDRRGEYSVELMESLDRWCAKWDVPIGTDVGRQIVADVIGKPGGGVNVRAARSIAKTTYAEIAAISWAAENPDEDIGVASKSMPASNKIMEALDNIVLGDAFRTFFPELIPSMEREHVNKGRIWFEGRTKTTQSTIEGRGLLTPWTSYHYGRIWGDDIVGLESGEASVGDAVRWIANLEGISKTEILGGTWRLFTGTRYEDGDDHGAAHENDSTLISIVLPIWIKPAYDLEHLMKSGRPILPEWYDVPEIKRKRQRTLSASGGAIAWLNNFEMTTVQGAERKISKELIDRQTLVVVEKDGREIWVRPDENGFPIEIEPRGLDRAAGIDQAISDQSWADEWVFALAAQDTDGHRYLVDGISGRGYESMLTSIIPRWTSWDCPRDVGIDTTGVQIITTDLMKREASYQRFVQNLVNVSSQNISKAIRITNYIVAGLRAGTLWIHPRLRAFMAQAMKWSPETARAKRPGTDDWLDAFSIALEVLRSTPISERDLEHSRYQAYTHREVEKNVDLAESITSGYDLYSILGMDDDF